MATKSSSLQTTKQSRFHFSIILRLLDQSLVRNLLVIILYCVIAVAAFWPLYPGDSGHLPFCACADPVQSTWFLRWLPFSLTHGLNPFFTSWVNYPTGANLAQNTLMPLLGLLAAPITLLASPIASFNTIAWLAMPLSATVMFYVFKRLSRSFSAAVIVGLLYGFSPFAVGQGGLHIMLSFIPLPPLILLAIWQIFIEQKKQPYILGFILGIETVAQFLISPEILALTAIAIGIVLIIGALGYKELVSRERLRFASQSLIIAALFSAICLAYPIWFMLRGDQHFTGPNFAVANPFRSDLFSLVAPTINQRIVPKTLYHYALTATGGSLSESGAYVGIVVLGLAIWLALRFHKNRLLIVMLAAAFTCWVLSLGPTLTLGTRITSIPLPFGILTHFPFLENILPARFSFAEWLLLSCGIGIGIGEVRKTYFEPVNFAAAGRTKILKAVVVAIVVAGTVLTLLPRWPYPTVAATTPAAFNSSSTTVQEGDVVLAYPFPTFPLDQAMLWQATNGMRFKLVGSYMQVRSPQGIESQFPALLSPPEVQSWLAYKQNGQKLTNIPGPPTSSIGTNILRSYIHGNNIGAVVIDLNTPNAQQVNQTITAALGAPQYKTKNLVIWDKVKFATQH